MPGVSLIDLCFVLQVHANSRERKMEDERNLCYRDVHHCVGEAIVYGTSCYKLGSGRRLESAPFNRPTLQQRFLSM